jgi:hypothetical protein
VRGGDRRVKSAALIAENVEDFGLIVDQDVKHDFEEDHINMSDYILDVPPPPPPIPFPKDKFVGKHRDAVLRAIVDLDEPVGTLEVEASREECKYLRDADFQRHVQETFGNFPLIKANLVIRKLLNTGLYYIEKESIHDGRRSPRDSLRGETFVRVLQLLSLRGFLCPEKQQSVVYLGQGHAIPADVYQHCADICSERTRVALFFRNRAIRTRLSVMCSVHMQRAPPLDKGLWGKKPRGGWVLQRHLYSGWVLNPHALSLMLNLKNSVFEPVPHDPDWYTVLCRDDTVDYETNDPIVGTFRLWNYTGAPADTSRQGVLIQVINMDTRLSPPAYDRASLEANTLDKRIKFCCSAMIPRFAAMPTYDEVCMIGYVVTFYRRFYPYTPAVDAAVREHLESSEFAAEMLRVANLKSQSWKERAVTLTKLRASYKGVGSDEVEKSYQWWRKWARVKDVTKKVLIGASVVGIPYVAIAGFKTAKELRREAVENMNWDLLGNPAGSPVMVKCSKLEIDRFIVRADRELPAVQDRCSVKLRDPLEIDNCDVKTDPVRIEGCTIEGVPMSAPVNNAANTHAAIRIRQTFAREKENRSLAKFLDFYLDFISNLEEIELDLSDECLLKYLNSHYSAKMAARLFKLYKETTLKDKDFRMSCFPKDEVYFKNSFDDNVKPRLIISYLDVMVAWFGFICHQITIHLSKKFNHDSQYYYACKSNPDILGKVVEQMEDYPILGDADGSNFDGSLPKEALLAEAHYVATKVSDFPGKETFLKHYSEHLYSNKRFGIAVKQQHGRMSGSGLTSAMNTLTSFVLFKYCAGDIGDHRVMCLGDDLVFACERLDEAAMTKNYAELGMTYEIKTYSNADNIEFCSGWFPPVDGFRRYVNKPGKVLSKFGVNLNKLSDPLGYLYGIAKSLNPTLGHSPVAGALMRTICKFGKELGLKPKVCRKDWNPYRPQGGIVLTPAPDTYEWFCKKYRVSLDEVLHIERQIERLTPADFPFVWTSHVLKNMAAVDLGIEIEPNPYLRYEASTSPERQEEIDKLRGVNNIVEAWRAGWRFGQEEDEILYTVYHKDYHHRTLHAFFSTMSYLSLDFGSWLHERYNSTAEQHGDVSCNKKKIQTNAKKAARRRRINRRKATVRKMLRAGGGAMASQLNPGFKPAGEAAGAFLARILGAGDYVVERNSILKGKVPDFRPSNHSIRVTHREYLGDISGSTDFSLKSWSINPGLVQTFPWLSQMAALYTQYTCHGLVFTFNSTSANALNSTNTALGTVVMATQYNAYDSPFLTKMEMENHEFSTSVKPSESAMHPIECKVSETPFRVHFTRTGALEASEDKRLYDWGVFSLATVGMQASAIIGELWVSYDIEFEKPRINNGTFGNSRHARLSNGPWDSSNPLGIIQRGVGGNMNLTVSATGSGWDTIHFDPNLVGGRFLLTFVFDGTGMSSAPSLSYTNCKLSDSGWTLREVAPAYYSAAVATNEANCSYLVDITGPAASIRITSGLSFSTATAVDVLVLQVPGPSDFPIIAPSFTGFSSSVKSIPAIDEEKSHFEWVGSALGQASSNLRTTMIDLLRHGTPEEIEEAQYLLSKLQVGISTQPRDSELSR